MNQSDKPSLHEASPSQPRLYYLLQFAAQRLRRLADEACLATAAVTATQGGVLYLIRETPGLSQRQLARALDQQDSAVVTMISRLLAAALIALAPRPDDARVSSLSLTDRGAAALAALEAEMDAFHEEIERRLSPDEREAVARALSKLTRIGEGARVPARRT